MLEVGKDILNHGQLTDSFENQFKPNWQKHNKTEGLYEFKNIHQLLRWGILTLLCIVSSMCHPYLPWACC